jgi:sirohydrochlorin cobaltochelatase
LKARQGIVLFAHGSRDPDWARPFEQLAAKLSKQVDAPVRLAYLEAMQPSLPEAIDALAAEKLVSIRVVPVFFGHGGHIKEDLPRLVQSARAKHPALKIELDPPIGEQEPVLDAIAEAILKRGARASP